MLVAAQGWVLALLDKDLEAGFALLESPCEEVERCRSEIFNFVAALIGTDVFESLR